MASYLDWLFSEGADDPTSLPAAMESYSTPQQLQALENWNQAYIAGGTSISPEQNAGWAFDPQYIEAAASGQAFQPVQAGAGVLPGFANLLPILLGLGKQALPYLVKYAPWIATAIGGGLGIAGLAGGGGGTANQQVIPGTEIALQGWGAPEPQPSLIAKQWRGIGGSEFYLLINGKVVVRKANGVWKVVRRPKMLHMKVSNPRMGDVVKADKVVARTAKILRRRLK